MSSNASSKEQTHRLRARPSPVRWLVRHLPTHETFVDVLGGCGTILLAKKPSNREVLNDPMGDVANLLKVWDDPSRKAALESLWSERGFGAEAKGEAQETLRRLHKGTLDWAWAFSMRVSEAIRGIPPFGKKDEYRKRLASGKKWAVTLYHVGQLGRWHDRLGGVEAVRASPGEVIDKFDDPKTLFFVDLSLVSSVPQSPGGGEIPLQPLLDSLRTAKGNVVLLGLFRSELAVLRKAGWQAVMGAVRLDAKTRSGRGSRKHPVKSLLVKRDFQRKIPLIQKVSEIIQVRDVVTMRVLRQYTHASVDDIREALTSLMRDDRVREMPSEARNRNKRKISIFVPHQ